MFFTVNTLFDCVDRVEIGSLKVQIPEVGSFDPLAAAVTALAFVLLFRSVLRTLGACALVGAVLYLATL